MEKRTVVVIVGHNHMRVYIANNKYKWQQRYAKQGDWYERQEWANMTIVSWSLVSSFYSGEREFYRQRPFPCAVACSGIVQVVLTLQTMVVCVLCWWNRDIRQTIVHTNSVLWSLRRILAFGWLSQLGIAFKTKLLENLADHLAYHISLPSPIKISS